MTLQQLFDQAGHYSGLILLAYLLLPVTALIALFLGRGEGHLSPWKYLYAVLVYLVSIPGIFAVALSVYFFLFQRGDILQTDLLFQVLPVLIMLLTLFLIRKNVSFDLVPGFGRISGLWFMLFAAMFLMWLLEKIHIVVFSYLPFTTLLLVFLLLFGLIYLGWQRFSR